MKITEEYKEAKPIITVAVAFVVWLRLGPGVKRRDCLQIAREWMSSLEEED